MTFEPSAANFAQMTAPKPLRYGQGLVLRREACLSCRKAHLDPPVTKTLRPLREYGILEGEDEVDKLV